MSITAQWDPVARSYTLSSTLDGPVVWWRSVNWPDGRGSYRRLGTGTSITDPTVPLDGGTVTWTASNGAADEEYTTDPPQASRPVLSVPELPSMPAVETVVFSQREYVVQGRSVLYEVLDREVPWVDPQPPIERTGTMVLHVAHEPGPFPGSELRRIRDMLRTGMPILLRSTCSARADTVSFVVRSFTEMHLGADNQHGPDRRISIDWQAVEPLWGEPVTVASRLWMQVPAVFGTWDDVEASGITWQQLAYGG